MAKRFKLPKKVRISGHVVNIKTVDVVDEKNLGIVGRSYLAQNKIVLGKLWRGNPLAEDHLRETFLHELIHHVSDKHRCNLSEKQVDSVSRGLYAAIKDNNLEF